MPALNFKRDFVADIRAGVKIHTIRARREDGNDPKIGDTLRLYTGMRTKQCEHILDVIVRNVRPLRMVLGPTRLWVELDGEELRELDKFARNDGFNSPGHMAAWFCDQRRAAYAPPSPDGLLHIDDALLIQWAPTEY